MTALLRAELLFDFGSPNAYLSHHVLPQIERRTGVRFFDAFFRAAYHRMWEEPKKMDGPEVFHEAFRSSGIDIDRIAARMQDDDVNKKLIDNTNYAVERGAYGSPTFFVGDEMFFGKNQLHDVKEPIVEQSQQARAAPFGRASSTNPSSILF